MILNRILWTTAVLALVVPSTTVQANHTANVKLDLNVDLDYFPASLGGIVAGIQEQVKGDLAGKGRLENDTVESILEEATALREDGFDLFALGALVRAEAEATFQSYLEEYYQNPESSRTGFVRAKVQERNFQGILLLNATRGLPDEGVGGQLRWGEFEYRLMAALYTAQSQWFHNHTVLIGQSLNRVNNEDFARIAIKNIEGMKANLKFITRLVNEPSETGRYISRQTLMDVATERMDEVRHGSDLMRMGPISRALRWMMEDAISADRPILALGVFLALIEQEGNLDAQVAQRQGRYSTAPEALPEVVDKLEGIQQDHPEFMGLIVVDRAQQSMIAAGADGTLTTSNVVAHASMAVVVDAFELYEELGMRDDKINISGTTLWIAGGLVGLAAALVVVRVARRRKQAA